jgi:uncharacterized protein (TIGR02444 family)
MTERKASPFWTFSLKLYRMPDVATACVKLQDLHGIDVNVMLFGCWLASQGRQLSRVEMHEIVDAADTWRRQVVVPLRSVRRILKSPVDAAGKGARAFDIEAILAMREKIKAVELESERLQQEALFALKSADVWGEIALPDDAARSNLGTYASAMRAEFDPVASTAVLTGLSLLLKDTPS